MSKLKPAVTALVCLALAGPAFAQERNLDDLFDALRGATEEETLRAIEAKIWAEWSKSGSPAMDLLLQRGRDALEAGETGEAIAHFSALVDHAPDFAEGWNMRATAYFQDGRVGQSLSDIRRALALNPRHFGALIGLATIFERLGQDEAALQAWRAVADLEPARPEAQEAIGRLERRTLGTSL